jgi:hypothetical protein
MHLQLRRTQHKLASAFAGSLRNFSSVVMSSKFGVEQWRAKQPMPASYVLINGNTIHAHIICMYESTLRPVHIHSYSIMRLSFPNVRMSIHTRTLRCICMRIHFLLQGPSKKRTSRDRAHASFAAHARREFPLTLHSRCESALPPVIKFLHIASSFAIATSRTCPRII